MTPKQVRVMGVYFKAAERLAWATEDLINAHECRKAGLLGNCERFEEVAKIRLEQYNKALAEYESL